MPDKLFVAALSVTYVGEDICPRSDTIYMFLRAKGVIAGSALAEKYCRYLKTAEGGGYIEAEYLSCGEVCGEIPSFVIVWTDDAVPNVPEDEPKEDTRSTFDKICDLISAETDARVAKYEAESEE